MRIGIWGSLWYGNFGDDLMAYMLAEHVMKRSHSVSLYKPSWQLSQELGAPGVRSVSDFVRSADAVVLAGGGWLCVPPLDKSGRNRSMTELAALVHELQRQKKPLIAISIGGDGSNHSWHSAQRDLLASPLLRAITCRLKSDISKPGIRERSRVAEHFPDVVLQTAIRFGSVAPGEGLAMTRCPIGLNVSSRRRLALLRPSVGRLSSQACFLQSAIDCGDGHLDSVPRGHTRSVEYLNVRNFAAALGSFELVVSTKLHVGVAALSYGVSFLSAHGRAKTKCFLEEVNMSSSYLRWPELTLMVHGSRELHRRGMPSTQLKNDIVHAGGHFQFLDEALESC
jgi:hypothetical protein